MSLDGLLSGPKRVRPLTSADQAFWWEGLAVGEVRIQRCSKCNLLRHPPHPRCAKCGSLEWDWIIASDRGKVHSFVVYHYPILPDASYPYTVALIDLPEGVRIVAPLLPNDGAGVKVGTTVALGWVKAEDGGLWPCYTSATVA
jgi:uncharacterized protein